MTATRTEAVDEIFDVINDAWVASVVPLGFQALVFEDNAGGRPDALTVGGSVQPWGYASISHADGFQASLTGAFSTSRFTRVGTVTVEVYTAQGQGRSVSDQVVQILLDALEGTDTPSGVIFRRVVTAEAGQRGVWFQVNVVANFEYDQVK